MFEIFQASEATATRRRAYFQAVDATDGITPETGLTGAGRISKNGAATAATSANITEIDSTNMPGRYYIEFTAAEIDTAGQVIFRYKTAACAEVIVQCTIVSYDPYAAGPTVAQIVDGVWNQPRASNNAAGSFGQGVASVQGNVTGSVGSVTGAVGSVTGNVGGNVVGNVNGAVVGNVGGIGASGIDSGSFTAAALNAIADNLLKRDWTGLAGEAARSMLNALRAIRNKSSVAAGTLTVTKEDDATTAWTAAVTGSPAVTNVDPA